MEEPEENDPNVVLPLILFEQESHDLICPECDHPVTGEVILQKRKREVGRSQSERRPDKIQEWPQKEDTVQGLSRSAKGKGLLEDTSDEDDTEVRNAGQEYELHCPDCESCITHEVILQKRKRAISISDTFPRRKPGTQAPQHLHLGTTSGGGMGEPNDSDEEDLPLKRHRSLGELADTDLKGRVVRRVLQSQRVYDLSCPDCASLITHGVLLTPKKDASGKPLGLRQKRRRRQSRSVTNSIDDNPWKTRYKLEHGHSKPIAAGKSAQRKKSQEEAQSRAIQKYGALKNSSIAEPLLPVRQHDDAGEGAIEAVTIASRFQHVMSKFEDIFGPCSITYFLLLVFLYCVWWLLRVI